MKILVVLTVLCMKYTNADYCSGNPALEGSPFTISTTIKEDRAIDGVLQWKRESTVGQDVTATYCDNNNNNKFPCSSYLKGYTSTVVPEGSTRYVFTLSSQNMSRLRDQTTWAHYGGSGDNEMLIWRCDLSVYSFQSRPACDNIKISEDGKFVTWTCTVDNVYPEMDCLFQYEEEDRGITLNVSSSYIRSERKTTDGQYSPRTVYHNYTCTMFLPVSKFTDSGPGTYQFKFTASVRVHVKGGEETTRTQESDPQALTLVMAQAELINCPTADDKTQGYIKEGVTKTCGCRIKTQGIPPGEPMWQDSKGNHVGSGVINGVNTLSVKYNPQDQTSPTKLCRGVSSFAYGPPAYFVPKFAYGPSGPIDILFRDHYNKQLMDDTVDKCEYTPSFYFECSIFDTANPRPNMTCAASDGSPTRQQSATNQDFIFETVPEGGGRVTITCRATNAIFPEISATGIGTVTVREPPLSSPVLTTTTNSNKIQTVENGGVVTVTSGDTVRVQCRVDGGFPGVSNVSITCADVTIVTDGAEATQTLNVKNEDNMKTCYCEAEHVTGCYKNNKTEFTLIVQLEPIINYYTANSEPSSLELPAGHEVTFICDVVGNPLPEVHVEGQRSGEIITLYDTPTGPYDQRSVAIKKMSCQDTDEYACVADNGVGVGSGGTTKTKKTRSLSVFVRCVPEFPSWFNFTDNEFSSTNGTDLEVYIRIIGYPNPIPKKSTLTKVGTTQQTRGMRRKREATGGDTVVHERLYNVDYTEGRAPNVDVILTLFSWTMSGQFVLNIDNGIGNGLDYTFNVNIEEDNNSEGNEDEDDSGGDNLWIGVGIGAALLVVVCIVCVIGYIKVKKMRLSRENEESRTKRILQHPQQQLKQQQQQQQQQQQSPVENEGEGEESIYQEIPADEYDILNVDDIITHDSEQGHKDRSQGYMYIVHKNNTLQHEDRRQEEEEAARYRNQPSIQQGVGNSRNTPIYINGKEGNEPGHHQRRAESQQYLNLNVNTNNSQSQGLDNPAHAAHHDNSDLYYEEPDSMEQIIGIGNQIQSIRNSDGYEIPAVKRSNEPPNHACVNSS